MNTSPDEVVVVYTTNDLYEAEVIRNELKSEGIACEVDGESQGGFTEIVQTKLLVRSVGRGSCPQADRAEGEGRVPPTQRQRVKCVLSETKSVV